MFPHYQFFAKVNDLFHKGFEHIEKLPRIGHDLAVKAFFELIKSLTLPLYTK